MKFLHDGGIGTVYMATGMCYKPRDSFGIAKDNTPPATLHYDRWLEPATYRPYYEKFVNDPEADAMLTRVYRKPYVINEEV